MGFMLRSSWWGKGFFSSGDWFCIFLLLLSLALVPVSCKSEPVLLPVETPLPVEAPSTPRILPTVTLTPVARTETSGGGIADEIRSHTEKGIPSSMLRALDIIRSRDLGSSEFGRLMLAINIVVFKTVYPAIQVQLPPLDPPVTHVYSRILRENERGVYTPPQPNSNDYLEYVLPFLAYYPGAGRVIPAERYLSALPDLERAEKLNPESALAGLFLGIVYEQTGQLEKAFSQYSLIGELFSECYPAVMGLARVLETQGRRQEAVRILSDLVIRFPDNFQVKRQLAQAYYFNKDWSRAETAVAEILQNNPRDAEFVLMRAHIFVEQGLFIQAQAPLDIYATINPNNRLYLFLRARVQAEGFQNRDSALNYLRSLARSSTVQMDDEMSVYMVKLLMESSRNEDQAEGREILRRLLSVSSPSLEATSLAMDDAIRREAWNEGRPFLVRLLEQRRSARDLLAAFTLEKGQGNNAAALGYARELYERDRNNEEGIITYITALIDTGRQDEASRMIEGRLNSVSSGVQKSRYFFLRSRVRNTEELVMNDLRSSLFEDPRNLNALIAMFEIYHRRRDERRAVYYLKQALALAPDNPRLKRYEAEYASSL